MKRAALLVLFAACGMSDKGIGDSGVADSATSSDGLGCYVGMTFNPDQPFTNDNVRVTAAVVGVMGVVTYDWAVFHSGSPVPFSSAAPDGSQIDFIPTTAGTYTVSLNVSGALTCPGSASQIVNVVPPGANTTQYRFRVRPLANVAPPQETVIQVVGGAMNIDRPVSLDAGIVLNGMITNGMTGVAAYVRFAPVSAPLAYTETFSSTAGTFSVRLLGQAHDVLVVPAVPGLAPRRFTWMPGMSLLQLDGGTVVTGTVRDPANAPLAGAKVQLTIDGVPSTLATTAADGSFSVRAIPKAAATVRVDVTPPSSRGLPILHAEGVLDVSQSVQVGYAAANLTCDLANTLVHRGASPMASAQVAVVASIAQTIGTVTAGTSANATGEVRIVATTNGSGRLPAMLVPRRALSAVVSQTSSDVAVVAIDTTSCAALSIDAPAPIPRMGSVQNIGMATLANVRVEATPVGALALASVQPVSARSTSTGAFTIALASGGHYDVRFIDPLGRAAPLVLTDVVATGVPTTAILPKALTISGKVSVTTSPNPVTNASVQVLCLNCTGIDASRPVGETATDVASRYVVAVPDPGTM